MLELDGASLIACHYYYHCSPNGWKNEFLELRKFSLDKLCQVKLNSSSAFNKLKQRQAPFFRK